MTRCSRGARWLAAGVLLAAPLLVADPVAAAPNAGHTICVALVVDFGSLGGGVDSSCATVRKGATGYDVLHAGGHTFTICSNGVLGNIDGKPADGCTEMKDNQHYWSYWHRAPGSSRWTYSNEGGGSYQPANASTEGWHWMDSPPANVPYDDICKPQHAASPTPAASRTATTTRTATTVATKTAAPSPTRATATKQPPRSRPTAATSTASAVPPSPAQSPTRPSRVAPTPKPIRAAPASSAHRSTSPVGVIAAVAAVVVLAGAALVQRRRRRS